MRTIAYVDGYNLFFGCLKGTPYKWLDIHALFQRMLRVQDPCFDLIDLKYFTSPIRADFARRGHDACVAQATYLRALKACGGVEIYEGSFSAEPTNAICWAKPPDKDRRVRVWRLEEKQTDVAIGIAMYRDAVRDNADQVVLISNDTDLLPALSAIRDDTAVDVGVIFPRADPERDPNVIRRPANQKLVDCAVWHRAHIKEAELLAAQLPRCVQTKRKPAHKPHYW